MSPDKGSPSPQPPPHCDGEGEREAGATHRVPTAADPVGAQCIAPAGAGAPLDLDLRFHVRRRSGARPNRPVLRAVCAAAIAGEGITGPVLLTLTVTDDAEIHQINLKHRNVDRPTDVLSFPLVDDATAFALPPGVPRELGDVVVSYPRAVAQAEEYGHSVEREFAYLVVHGVLHILGHDHEVPKEQAVMREREEAAMAVVGLLREP